MLFIAQISDTHISARGKKTYGIAPMAEHLRSCIDALNQLDPRPDLVLVTGDVSNCGEAEEFSYAADLLALLEMPYYVIPGNHDHRARLWAQFGGSACPSRSGGFIQYVVELESLRLIALDSTIPGQSGGEICVDRAAWLKDRLSEAPEKPTVIFMHHPPVKCGVIETDIDGFIGARRLGEVVEQFANIQAIVCGHIHTPAHTRWRGTVISTAPSMGMQLVLDFHLKREEFVLSPPAYQLHYWTAEQNLITHTAYVHHFDGPYLFQNYL